MCPHEYLRRPVVGVMIMNDKARLRKAGCEMIKQNRINIRQAA
jgi:hypothetical protein